EATKMKKQMSYADTHHIPFVALVGESEIEAGKIALKNMITGEQQLVSPAEAIAIVR
ncbi:MAG: histidine--tRNA ligase, partial [Bacteroidaceae bacterium]|nr:histidine--tRNA ligase [Bacteroidaceae bacterium]